MAHGKPLHALTEEHTAVGFNTDRVVINTHKIGSMDPAQKFLPQLGSRGNIIQIRGYKKVSEVP